MTGIFIQRNFCLGDTPPLVQKVALVTGGAAGIGQEITAQLLIHDIEKVFVLARTVSKFEHSRQQWNERRGIKLLDSSIRAEFVPCDLGDISQVRKAAEEIIKRTSRLDIVVCNAAIPNTPSFNPTPQNLDPILATNHIGHHVLVTALLPLLSSTATTHATTPRVIITTSSLHYFCRSLSIRDLSSPKPVKWPASYDSIWRYGRSKLCNILFAKELSRRLMSSSEPGADKIYVNCYFPGNIATDAMDTWKVLFGNLVGWTFKSFFKAVGQGVEDAAATVLFLGSTDLIVEKEIRGRYFVPIATEASVSGLAENEKLAGEVWVWTEEVVMKALGS